MTHFSGEIDSRYAYFSDFCAGKVTHFFLHIAENTEILFSASSNLAVCFVIGRLLR